MIPALAGESAEFPVLYLPSRVATEPWRLPSLPSPSGLAADQARIGSLEIRAASLVGPAHRSVRPALPRQDAYRLGQDAAGQHLIIAVADGMSDSKHSEVGANVAVAAVVGRIREQLDEGTGNLDLDADDIFLTAARQMSGAARQRGWPEDDVRAAIALAVILAEADRDGTRPVWLACLADVSAWRRRPVGWEPLLGDVKDGLDAGRLTRYLPFHPKDSSSRVIRLGPADVMAVTTDGIADAFSMVPGAAEWFSCQWQKPRRLTSFVSDVGYEASQFNDDRTAVLVWCMDEMAGT
jgi:hypothetical protein